ncbi:hypothetical protein V1277_000764 [Bradyrhizobium sp. AZCC 1588]
MIPLWQKHAMVNVVNHPLRSGRSIGVAGGQGWQPVLTSRRAYRPHQGRGLGEGGPTPNPCRTP